MGDEELEGHVPGKVMREDFGSRPGNKNWLGLLGWNVRGAELSASTWGLAGCEVSCASGMAMEAL